MKQTFGVFLVCILFLFCLPSSFSKETQKTELVNEPVKKKDPPVIDFSSVTFDNEQESASDKDFPTNPKIDTYRFTHRLQIQYALSNLGPGFHIGYHLNNRFYVGGEILTDNYSSDYTTDQSRKVNLSGKLSTDIIALRYYPFDSYELYIQGGYVYRNWIIDAQSRDINSNAHQFTLRAKFPTSASILGFGGNKIFKNGFSFGAGIGVISGGEPTVSIADNKYQFVIEEDDSAEKYVSEIDTESNKIKSDFESYSDFIIIYTGIGWNF